jgi:mannose-6-phosphate isomerase-like protein (cupin superfamily)
VTEDRPWGSYTVLDDQPHAKVKRIEVAPGMRLSYQRHAKRAEHWFVVAGRGTVTLNGTIRHLGAGDAVDIPTGAAHRVENAGDEPLVFVEVQTGTYFGEDDIERLEDDYGRT